MSETIPFMLVKGTKEDFPEITYVKNPTFFYSGIPHPPYKPEVGPILEEAAIDPEYYSSLGIILTTQENLSKAIPGHRSDTHGYYADKFSLIVPVNDSLRAANPLILLDAGRRRRKLENDLRHEIGHLGAHAFRTHESTPFNGNNLEKVALLRRLGFIGIGIGGSSAAVTALEAGLHHLPTSISSGLFAISTALTHGSLLAASDPSRTLYMLDPNERRANRFARRYSHIPVLKDVD